MPYKQHKHTSHRKRANKQIEVSSSIHLILEGILKLIIGNTNILGQKNYDLVVDIDVTWNNGDQALNSL